jgi:energy-coupling factor transport system permease protein
VLEDTLERSLLLAAAMDSRGYGRSGGAPHGHRAVTASLTLGGLLASAVGIYGVLDATTPALMGTPLLLAGLALGALGLWVGGRHAPRSTYRPDPWRAPEWLTLGCGLVTAAVLVAMSRSTPDVLAMPLTPLAVPPLPLAAVLAILVGALPARLTPPPPDPTPRLVQRGAREEVVVGG